VRKAVEDFAHAMEAKLSLNDHKGGWDKESVDWLFSRLQEEVEELRIEMSKSNRFSSLILQECIDVANFAMMIYDRTPSQPEWGGVEYDS